MSEEKVDRRRFNKGRGRKKTAMETAPPPDELSTNNELINEQPNTTMENETENTNNAEDMNNESETAPQQTVTNVLDDKLIDPSKLSDEITNAETTPIDKPVKEEEYRNPYRGQGEANKPIEEPVFQPPNLDSLNVGLEADAKAKEPEPAKKDPAKSGTPLAEKTGLTDVFRNDDLRTPDEKRAGAEMAVDAALEFYDLLHKGIQWLGKVNEDKLRDKAIANKIDLDIRIPVDENNTPTLKEFVQRYNQSVEETIVVDPDFIKKVRPVMVRVFEKNGWGMSDEMYLMLMFGRDLGEKAVLVFSMKRDINRMLKSFETQHTQAIKAAEAKHNMRVSQESAKPLETVVQKNNVQQETVTVIPNEEPVTETPAAETPQTSNLVVTDFDEEMAKQ